jgi:hypothetical protein
MGDAGSSNKGWWSGPKIRAMYLYEMRKQRITRVQVDIQAACM